MTVQTRQRVTAAELARMAEDGSRYELVRGELRKMPPSGSEHEYIALRIASRLEWYVDTNGGSAIDGADVVPGWELPITEVFS